MTQNGSLHLRKVFLRVPCILISNYGPHPGILGPQLRYFQLPSQLSSHSLQLVDHLRFSAIKKSELILQEGHTRFSDSFAVFERSEILDVQFDANQIRYSFVSIRIADMTDAMAARHPVKDSGLANKPRALGSEQHSAEIFTVLVIAKVGVPGPRRFHQFPAHEPSRILHVKIIAHFP